jgi:hypothetical protein
MDRTRTILAALAVAVALVAGSPPRLVGDGGEYLAMAYNFAAGDGPALAAGSISTLQAKVAAFDHTLSEWRIEDATIRGQHGGRDFLHFWFYPLLVAPLLWITEPLHLPPTYAFATLNVVLLLFAFWRALPRIGLWLSILLWAGPLVWWIDKTHTEAFTFALLAIAVLEFEERPWWSLVAAGAATTQNLPIAVFAAGLGVAALVTKPAWLRDRRFQIGAIVGALLTLLHPVYSYTRHGTWSLLLRATKEGIPSFAEWRAVATDLQIGLLPNYPFLAVALLAAVITLLVHRRVRELTTPLVIVSAASAAFFLYSFARTTNLHHGATPSLSRYGLWLIPLAIPVLALAQRAGRITWTRVAALSAVVSSIVSVFAFHPRLPQYAYEPTPLAAYVWTQHPNWNNPLPEIFSEVTLRAETQAVPAATANCEKVLLGGTRPGWPLPCFPAEVPALCRATGRFCYANRTGGGYAFVPAPGRPDMFPARTDGVWPATGEAAMRAILARWDWFDFRVNPDGAAMLRSIARARVTSLERAGRTVLIVEPGDAGASLTLRPPGPLSGEMIDAATGETLVPLQFHGPAEEAWTIALPAGHAVIVVRLDVAASGAGL